ncbi:MAG TPA: extracellular solute-binding protein [Alphaproteobacteria bacterium]|jgi:iron(III) transport system substrate-binding protein|nr:extracellular solute-binding protein [Alphaproteobacteria bacterium]
MTKLIRPALLGLAVAFAATPALAENWKQSPAVQALYAKAKQEGEAMIWAPNGREVDWIPAAFAAEFPGIKVNTLGDNDIAPKIIAESRAGRHQVDVYWCSITCVEPIVQRELPTKVDWSMFGVTKDNTAFDGKMGYTNNIVYVVAYDTRKMSEADMPKTWDQLLDPKYKDKMTGSLFLLPRLVSALSLKWGQDKALDFARKLKDTGILLTRAPRESILQSGERVIAAGEVDTLPKLWAQSGMPVKYVIPSPVVLGQFGATVLEKAPHPNAARLLAGWLASKEGKVARTRGNLEDDYRPGADNPEAKQIYASGVPVIEDTVESMKPRAALYKPAADILTGQAK